MKKIPILPIIFILPILLVLVLIIVIGVVFTSPFICIYFALRFYHLRKLFKLSKKNE